MQQQLIRNSPALLPGPQRPDQEDRFTIIADFGAELPPYARALLEGLRCRCTP
jgi:hypothetical protein